MQNDFEPVVWKKKPVAVRGVTPTTQNAPGTALFRKLDADEPPPPPEPTFDFAKKLRSARVGKNMTQKQLAVSVNVQVKIIEDLEANRGVAGGPLRVKLGRVLGILF